MSTRIFLICIASIAGLSALTFGQDQVAKPLEHFKELAQQLAAQPPVNCCYDNYDWPTGHPEELESKLFDEARKFITDSLNNGSSQPMTAVKEALKTLSLASDNIHKHWPEDHRFRYEIFDVSPIILAKTTLRSSAAAIAFYMIDSKRKTTWSSEDVTQNDLKRNTMIQNVQVYPLSRGPSNQARFLIFSSITACGHGTEEEFTGYQMNPDTTYPEQILHRKGSEEAFDGDIEERESPQSKFNKKPLRKFNNSFNASGKKITLPYCWFSVVDTWANPTLCMADTYDLSMDEVRFVGRKINRPDIYAVAKAIEHAQNGELESIRGYTVTSQVAKKILNSMPSHIFNEKTTVTHKGSNRELIRLQGYEIREFEMQRINGTWLISNYRLVPWQ
jgi:hypothetical protein